MARAPRFVFRIHNSIRSITIEGFKSIVQQTLELGRLNVLIGANGAGKTAVLEAIGVLGAAAEGRVDDGELLRRGVRPGVPRLYKSAFETGRLPRGIKLKARSAAGGEYAVMLDNPQESAATPWRFNAESLSQDDRPLVTRSPRGGNYWDPDVDKQPFKPQDAYTGLARSASPFGPLPKPVDQLLTRLRGFVIYDPQTSILRGTQADLLQRDPLGVQGGRLAEAIEVLRGNAKGAEALAEASDLLGWTSDIGVDTPTPDLISPSIPVANRIIRFTDRYMRSDRNLLSAYDASEGALYVLFALAVLFHPKAPGFFAIENIDHALHPRLARALVERIGKHAKASRRQVILTTHNPLVLDGLRLADDDIRLFTVERTEAGHTVVGRVEYTEALQKAEESGLTLSQMWTRGLLGAVPDLW